MFESIQRPYKERSASETTTLIKEKLIALGLQPKERFRASPYPGLFSVSLELPEEKGGFRSYGKGRTLDYCLASAYAEYIERIQNGLFASFPRTIVAEFKERYGFYYSPDECYLSSEEFKSLDKSVTDDIIRYNAAGQYEFMNMYYERVRAHGAPGVIAVPFLNTKQGELISLPLNLLLLTVGSNGMAAGNTQAEATYQALCELLERWGAAEVFYNQLTPPTVPLNYLKQFTKEYEIIEKIEESGKYQVIIKDFSADKQIPALGIIVENIIARQYRLDVGCDTCFQVALSRCLTEVYQGIWNESIFDACALPIPSDNATYFQNSDELSLYCRYCEFSQFTKDGHGQFPLSLFGQTESYNFNPNVWTQRHSYTEEVRRLVNFFHVLGHNVYIRDVSFLGFPSVFCYVPEVSALGRKSVPPLVLKQIPIMFELDRVESIALRLKSCTDEELMEIAEILSLLDGSISYFDVFGIKLKESSPSVNYNLGLLLSQIWYKLGNFDRASKSFKSFLNSRKEDNNPYYKLVDHYLEQRASGLSNEITSCRLTDDPTLADLAKVIIENWANPSAVFERPYLPNCPDCKHCELRSECVTAGKILMMDTLYPAMAKQRIDQGSLTWVISNCENKL